MSLDSTSLREGLPIVFHCLGSDVQEAHQFLKGSFTPGSLSQHRHGDVQLIGTRTEEGTEWIAHETPNPGVFTFECAGTGFFFGTSRGLFLAGETIGCKVILRGEKALGTAWQVSNLPEPGIHVAVQCLNDQGQPLETCSFLDGHTRDGFVGLADSTDEKTRSGTHWELIVFEPEVVEGGGGDLGSVKFVHV